MVVVLTSLCSSCSSFVGVLTLHFGSFYGPGWVFTSGKGTEEMFFFFFATAGVLSRLYLLYETGCQPHYTLME